MYTHNSTDIASKIPSTGGHSEVFDRIEAIRIDHEISVVLVNSGGLAPVAVVEEFR